MSSPTEFELEGLRFEVRRLAPEDACLGLEVLGRILGPAALEVFAAREGDKAVNHAAIFQALLQNASQLTVLLRMFAARTRFDRQKNGTLVDLKHFTDEVFGGRLDLMIAFLVHAARAEYAYFLSGGGALAGLVDLVGTASASPTAPTG